MFTVLNSAWAESINISSDSTSQHMHHQKHIHTTTSKKENDVTLKNNPTPGLIDKPSALVEHKHDFSHLPKPEMGDHQYISSLIADRVEMVNSRRDFSMTYDWQAWVGQDIDKILVRAEGEIDQGSFKNARNELLWAHALTPFWDSQLGVRYDSGGGTNRVWGAFGMQGYAPYWVYVEATAYLGEDARTAFRLELEYDLLFTQKLILQPRIETNFYSRSDPGRAVSSGLSNIEAGLRLRYEIAREFAPYIGIEWASNFGSAAELIRSQGKQVEEARFIAGVHFWF